MSLAEEVDQVPGTLYEAPATPGGWIAALQGMAGLLNANGGHFFTWNRNEGAVIESCTSGYSEEAQRAYANYYGAIDPRRRFIADNPVGEWLACHHHFDDAYARRSEFYNDFLIPAGARYALCARIFEDQGVESVFGLLRPAGASPFERRDVELIRRLTGHLLRAARLQREIHGLRLRCALGTTTLDSLRIGVVVADRDAGIKFSNAFAEDLLRHRIYLWARNGTLAAPDASTGAALGTLIRNAVDRARGGAMLIPRGEHRAALQILVAPLPARSSLAAEWQVPLALILISDPDVESWTIERCAATAFGLSAAETGLVIALAKGKTPAEFAAEKQVSMHTIRSQLRSVFAKTGTRRQAELIRLISALPPLMEPGPTQR